MEFQKQVNSDFTFIPFNGKNVGITFEEDSITCENLEEALFLSSLVELIKISDNMYCHLCNEELLRRFPGPLKNRQWISKMLGKFSSLGILEISTYEINGSIWYRDINLIYPANHILFVMEQKLSA